MKDMIKLPAIVLGLLLLLTGTTQKVMAQNEEVSLQSFYDELSPYGQWIQDPQYGYVWRPDVDQDEFRPYYSNGRWAMTEYGNTWVSNYDWGWAPFHYGRWVYNRYNSWVWIPDTVWGPAWVSWRSGGGYYGWAPLGPSISIGINIGRGGYRIPDMCWNFIPYNNIYYNSYPRYYGGRNRVYIQNTVIINNTYVRNNRTYYTGPRADEIRRATNQNVRVYSVNRSSRPGASRIDNNSVNIYNPRPSRSVNNAKAAPRNVVQGSINRGPVGRDGRESVNNRSERNNASGNVYQGGRNGSTTARPSREREAVNQVQQNRGSATNRDENINRQSGNTRPEVNNSQAPRPQTQQRVEQKREVPQRVEQKREVPQRVERSQPAPQAPQQRQAPARTERAERPQPQRVERTQSAPQRSNGNANESRGSRGGERGRG
ncbi:MAG: DUF6600 domain-containing protein [Bacteroidota bacterium]